MKRFLVTFVLVILGAYLFGVLLFIGHFPFNTTVNGESAVYKTPAEVSLDLMHKTEYGMFQFELPDGSKEYATFAQLGIYNAGEAEIAQTKVNPFLWPLSLFTAKNYPIEQHMTLNADMLLRGMKQLDFVVNGTIPPTDAYVSRAKDGSFAIIGDTIGTKVNLDALSLAVQKAVSSGTMKVNLLDEDCYQHADVRAEDGSILVFGKAADSFNTMQISLDFGAGENWTISEKDLESFTYVKQNHVYVSEDKVRSYVADLAEEYDTYGTQRVFHTSTGKDVMTSSIGTGPCDFEGWQMDQENMVYLLMKVLSGGKHASLTVPWLHRGVTHGPENDIGDTYLEISIDDQHMWLVEDGQVVKDTSIVTGIPSDPLRATPTGLWKTTDLYREHTMTGTYGALFCHYFIRVTLDGIGVHDASWRSDFGGDIYLTNGSHGCINTPYDDVEFIFQELQARDSYTPIIIW